MGWFLLEFVDTCGGETGFFAVCDVAVVARVDGVTSLNVSAQTDV